MSGDVAELERAADSPLDDWREVAVADVVAMLPGFAFKSENFVTDTDAGLPLIRIRDLGLTNTATRYVGDYDEAFAVRDGDILVGMDGTFEAVRWQGGNALLNQRVLKLSPARPDAIDEGYLFYRVQPALSELEQTISGTTVKHLSTKDLKRLAWQLPPLDEQRRIAEVLRSVDEAIAAAGAVLERARAARSAVLNDLLRRADGNWQTVPFSEAAQINPKRVLPRVGAVPFLDMANLPLNGAVVDVTQLRPVSSGGARFRAGDTLFARITPCAENGKLGYVETVMGGDVAQGSTEFIVMAGREGVTTSQYVRCLAGWDELRQQAIGLMEGTSGRQRIPSWAFDMIDVPLPPLEKQEQITTVMQTMDSVVLECQGAHQQQQSFKTGLMSDLLSGRVRVPA